MAISHDLKMFEQLAGWIGPGKALLICAFFGQGNKTLYVPATPFEDHRLEKLIGRDSFELLVSAAGGKTLSIPSLKCLNPIRCAGQIAALSRYQLPVKILAESLDLTEARVYQIKKQLRLEGFGDLLSAAESFEKELQDA